MDTHELFGLRVKQIRKRKYWNQEKLAYYAGFKRAYISKVERGQNIQLANIIKIAAALDVTPCELFQFSDLK